MNHLCVCFWVCFLFRTPLEPRAQKSGLKVKGQSQPQLRNDTGFDGDSLVVWWA